MRAIGYVRVSTEEQAQTGVSLDAQEEKIRAYCIAKEWDLLRVIRDEGFSAKDLNRPGIQEIIEGCKRKEFDVVVILKLVRLTRSVKDLGYLVEDVFHCRNGGLITMPTTNIPSHDVTPIPEQSPHTVEHSLLEGKLGKATKE